MAGARVVGCEAGVIVVGAGPVGLVAAYRLALAGIPVLVLEREAAISRQLRASTFHPPTLDMLDVYGLGQQLVERGRTAPSWQVRMHETGERALFDLRCLAGHTAHPYRLQCEQWVLSELLLARLGALSSAAIRFENEAVAVGQGDEAAWVEVVEGGQRRRIDARWVVGCDGARSLVRGAIGAAFEGETYPETTVLVATEHDFATTLEGLSGVNYVWKGSSTYSLLRLRTLWRASLYPREGETVEEMTTDGWIETRLKEIVPDLATHSLGERRPYRVHQRLASRWRDRRLFIAGDAAHLNSPKGGMGMNGGIHDAFELTDALVAAWRGGDPSVLDRYELRRLPVVRDEIIAQAGANRARMNENDPEARRRSLHRLQAIARDPEERLQFLLRSSMIAGLRKAAAMVA